MRSLPGPRDPGVLLPATLFTVWEVALYMLASRPYEPPQEAQATPHKLPSSAHLSRPDECGQPNQRVDAERVPKVRRIAPRAVREARAVDVIQVPKAEIAGLIAVRPPPVGPKVEHPR